MPIPNLPKKFLAVLAITGSLVGFTIPAQAAPWTFTQSGTIRDGADYSGLFGAGPTALAGKSFAISYVLDPELYAERLRQDNDFSIGRYGAYAGFMTIRATIGDVTNTYVLDPTKYSDGGSFLMNGISSGTGQADQAAQYHTGITAEGEYVSAMTTVFSLFHNYNIGLDFAQRWSYAVRPGDYVNSGFTVSGKRGDAQFFGGSDLRFSINEGDAHEVPEPTTFPMILIGVAMLALARFGVHRQRR